MRIAFVVHTFRMLDQVARLVRTLDQGCDDPLIVLTHNRLGDPIDAVTDRERVDCVLPAVPGRGHFGLIDSYLSALRWLASQPKAYDWVVLLSGQDYPIRSLREFQAELSRSEFDGYFHHFDPFDPSPEKNGRMVWSRQEGEDRYRFRYVVLKDELSLTERALLRLPRHLLRWTRDYRINSSYGLCFGRRADDSLLPRGFRLYGGSYWHIVSARCAGALLNFVDTHADVVDHFRGVMLPDECFIQSVILNEGTFRISSDDLRYFDFRGSRQGRPKTLAPADLEAAIASRSFFARKIDAMLYPSMLDGLDSRALS